MFPPVEPKFTEFPRSEFVGRGLDIKAEENCPRRSKGNFQVPRKMSDLQEYQGDNGRGINIRISGESELFSYYLQLGQ